MNVFDKIEELKKSITATEISIERFDTDLDELVKQFDIQIESEVEETRKVIYEVFEGIIDLFDKKDDDVANLSNAKVATNRTIEFIKGDDDFVEELAIFNELKYRLDTVIVVDVDANDVKSKMAHIGKDPEEGRVKSSLLDRIFPKKQKMR